MTDFCRDFERLMHKGFNVYVESDDDNSSIYLEAHDRADDSHIVKASYTPTGKRASYNEEDLVSNILKLLTPTKVR